MDCLCDSHINQSERVVLDLGSASDGRWCRRKETYGKRPMAFTFQMPTANATSCMATYTSFVWSSFDGLPSVVNRSKAWFVFIKPTRGFLKAMKTIMMLKICSELPDMYIIMAVIGRDLTGASATSHAFFSFSVSISSVVGAFRGCSLPSFFYS